MEGWSDACREKQRSVEELLRLCSGIRWFRNPDMKALTTWRIGGRALALFDVADEEELATVLSLCGEFEIPWRILGRGSNILVSDQGFPGVVVRLVGQLAECRLLEGNRVEVGGGVTLGRFICFAIEQGLGGCEFLVGVPGTVGGAVVLNAGCFGGEVGALVERVLVWERGNYSTWKGKDELSFSYRTSNLRSGEAVVLKVVFRLSPESRESSEERIRRFSLLRRNSQPLDFPSAGSVFRNPPGDYAARLIERLGLKGLRLGQAQISPKHSNFIVNLGGAMAWQVEYLMEWVRREVFRQTGVWLENEVELWK